MFRILANFFPCGCVWYQWLL